MKNLTIERLIVAALMTAASILLIACGSGGWDSHDYSGGYDPYGYGSTSSSSGQYGQIPTPRRDAGFDPACVDPTGFGGQGCYKCAPQTNDQLLNACTTSHFESFDNAARIAGFNPSNPRPALQDLGPTPAPFEGEKEPVDTLPPAPACPLASKPNPVMVLGGTGLPLETIAKAMGTQATIFYLEKSSCDGVASLLLDDPKLSGEVVYYDTDGTKNRCTLSAPQPADVGLSSLFAETCAGQSGLSSQIVLPNDVGDFLGPASTVMFAVPATSHERAISAEAAYRVYGWGRMSSVTPWTDENVLFRRTPSSGNQQTVALSLGLPAESFRGRDSSGSSNMLNALRTSPNPTKTLGISSSEIVDVNRDVVKSLAYQHYDQAVAFYPDSDPATLDRRNVRDGHYFLWLPLHVLARTRGGEPVAVANDALTAAQSVRDAAVKRLVYVMISRQEPPVPSVDLLGALKRVGNVPPCAMHVKRSREAAPLEPAEPTYACDCAFEASAPGTTPAECKACASALDCPTNRPSCRFGYCEASK